MEDDSRKNSKRDYSWLSLGLGISIIPILIFTGPLLSLFQDEDLSLYAGLTIGLVAISLQLSGFAFGLTGLVRGPKRFTSGLGTVVCFLLCFLLISKVFK